MLALALYVPLSNLAVSNSQWPSYTRTISFWSSFKKKKNLTAKHLQMSPEKLFMVTSVIEFKVKFWMIQVVSVQKKVHISVLWMANVNWYSSWKQNIIILFIFAKTYKTIKNMCCSATSLRCSTLMNDCQLFPHINLQNYIVGTSIAASSREIIRRLFVSVWIFVGEKKLPILFRFGAGAACFFSPFSGLGRYVKPWALMHAPLSSNQPCSCHQSKALWVEKEKRITAPPER